MSDQTIFQLTENLLVRQSRYYQTNSAAVLMDGKAVVVDPGVFQSDLEAFRAALQPFQVTAGFITHAHWDHILWLPSLGDGPRYCSMGTDYQMMVDEQGLRSTLDQIETESAGQYGYWERSRFFDRTPLTPGTYNLHGFQFELIELPGHVLGQAGFIFQDQGVVFVGDVLSDIEVPTVPNRAAITEYLATLDQLEGIVRSVNWIIPGHGYPANAAEALGRLARDRIYLLKLISHPGISMSVPDESFARIFLAEIGEQRAFSSDGWGMHLENLRNIYAN